MTSFGAIAFAKRALPFIAALLLGVFITSLFVDLSRPKFNFRARGWERHREMQRIRVENEELRNENLRLRNQLESSHWNAPHKLRLEESAIDPTFDELPAPPPPPPVAPRTGR
jgi:hypothetical protein